MERALVGAREGGMQWGCNPQQLCALRMHEPSSHFIHPCHPKRQNRFAMGGYGSWLGWQVSGPAGRAPAASLPPTPFIPN
jgi:hypothetical protein